MQSNQIPFFFIVKILKQRKWHSFTVKSVAKLASLSHRLMFLCLIAHVVVAAGCPSTIRSALFLGSRV